MNRIKVNTNFYLDEFVDPYTYFNTEDHGLSLMDKRLFEIAQLLRYHYMKPLYINNWWHYFIEKSEVWSTDYIIKRIETRKRTAKWSGLRTERCTIGSVFSAHKSAQAIDPKGNEIELFGIVKKNAEVFYSLGLRRLEDISITPGWLHLDTLERNTTPNTIRVVDLQRATQIIKW